MRLQSEPGFRACGFSRLTGGQWAGSAPARTPQALGAALSSSAGQAPASQLGMRTLQAAGTMDVCGMQLE